MSANVRRAAGIVFFVLGYMVAHPDNPENAEVYIAALFYLLGGLSFIKDIPVIMYGLNTVLSGAAKSAKDRLHYVKERDQCGILANELRCGAPTDYDLTVAIEAMKGPVHLPATGLTRVCKDHHPGHGARCNETMEHLRSRNLKWMECIHVVRPRI